MPQMELFTDAAGSFIATSAIDYKTDTIIQTSLRNELGGDVTLITVAHRLQTIMDADKIVCFVNIIMILLSLTTFCFLDGASCWTYS